MIKKNTWLQSYNRRTTKMIRIKTMLVKLNTFNNAAIYLRVRLKSWKIAVVIKILTPNKSSHKVLFSLLLIRFKLLLKRFVSGNWTEKPSYQSGFKNKTPDPLFRRSSWISLKNVMKLKKNCSFYPTCHRHLTKYGTQQLLHDQMLDSYLL